MMLNTQALQGALPIYAAMIAEKTGIRVQAGSKAATNGTVITYPKNVIRDPDVNEMIYGMMMHEGEHVNDTDMNVFNHSKTKLHQEMTNILEDYRIEKNLGLKFKGGSTRLDRMVTALNKRGFFNPVSDESSESDVLCAYYLSRLRCDGLGQKALSSYKEAAEHQALRVFNDAVHVRLQVLLDMTHKMKSTRDASDLAWKIINDVEDAMKQDPQSNEESSPESSGQQDKNQPGGDSQDAGPSGADGQSDGNRADAQDSQPSRDQQGQDSGQADNNGTGGNDAGAGNKLDDPTQSYDVGQMAQDAINDANDSRDPSEETVWYEDMQVASSDSRTGRDQGLEIDAGSQTAKLRTRLYGLLQAKTMARRRKTVSGTRINKRALIKVPLGESRVFIKRKAKRSVNTDVVILLDTSGSMSSRIDVARLSALAITNALQGINGVGVAAAIFPGTGASCQWLKAFHESVRMISQRFAVHASGGTPMNQAILNAARALHDSKAERHMILTITDGVPSNREYTKELVKTLNRAGVEMLGLGIGDSARVGDLFPVHRTITTVDEMSSNVFEMLQEQLIASIH